MASKDFFVGKVTSSPFVALNFSYSTVSNILIETFAAICAVYLLKTIETCLHRVYFDQLSHIPGPRLAAASKLWWVYNNVLPHGGKLVFKLPELHKKYGPVVRISPTEVTIHDIDSYHEVHKFGSQFFKDPDTYDQPAINHIAQGCLNNTIDHKKARLRRQALAPYLRPQAIRNNDPIVLKHLQHLTDRLEKWGEEKPLMVQSAYRCMAGDIVSAITYNGRLNFLDHPEFEPEYVKVAGGSSKLVGLIASFRALGDLLLFALKITPAKYAPEAFVFMGRFRGMIAADVDRLRVDQEKIQTSNPKLAGLSGESVFYRAMRDPTFDVPEYALISDALVFLAAGMDTTAHTLTLLTFHLLRNNRKEEKKLLEEVKKVLPHVDDETSSAKLMQLPYLAATIKEALRHSMGVPNGMRRIVPEGGHNVGDVHIPAGTVIVHPNYVSHFNPDVFSPDPHEFRPQRWLEADPQKLREMDRNSNPFLRGARACLGINLAYSELFMATAHLIRRFEFSFVDAAEAEYNITHWTDENLPRFAGPLRLYVKKRYA